jgi:uncharacterized protein
MKLNGTHTFKAPSAQVFQAILNPTVLKNSISGCEAISYTDANTIHALITVSMLGFKGTFNVNIVIAQRQEPTYLELHVSRKGRGGSINAVARISLRDEADGALLSYDGNADLEGQVALINNPIGQSFVKKQIENIFNNVEKSLG